MNRIFRFIRELAPGDAAVALLLGFFVILGMFISLASLVRSYQVTVPAFGGTLSEGVVGSPRFVNPLLAVSDSDRDLATLTYAGLMGHKADGTLEPVLAKSYEITNDGTIYTFTLRSDVKFSDGTPVTADDVVYTIQKAQDSGVKSAVYANWANVRVEAVNAQVVRFVLPKAYAPFLEDAALGILPKHIWQGVNDEEFAFAPQNTLPVGAGPFTAASVTRASDGTIMAYALDSFEGYALGQPYLSHVKFTFYKDEEALQLAYKDGAIKSAYGIAIPSAVSVPYARVFGVFFNPAKDAKLEDVKVRKALSLAVDRTTLTQDVLGGYATPVASPLPAGSRVDSIPLPDDATRLTDARQLLADAGYAHEEASNTWTKDGQPLTVRLTTSNVPELKVVAGQIQKDWQAFGIQTELELHDANTLTQSVIRPRAYSALLFGEVIGTSPDLYAFWSSTEAKDPGLNVAGYQNADVDTILQKARTESDNAARNALLAQAQQKISDDYPAAFLYTPSFVYDAPAKIQGIKLSQVSSPSNRFWGIRDWYRYSEHVWPIFVPVARAGTNR